MATKERAELKGMLLAGRYRVGLCIGVGGTGVVFHASDEVSPGPNLVVKVLRPVHVGDPDLVRRLYREAEVALRVRHPGIVPVYDHGTLPDGSPFLVMPWIGGESLVRVLRRHDYLPWEMGAALAVRVCAILHSVHAHGYVHRDVKPEHVLLDRNADGTLQMHLLDFGVCAAATAPADERERERGRVFGTPSYASPEQASGNPDVDGRVDVYGLGVLLFELLTGRVPFTAPSVPRLLRSILDQDAPPVSRYVADIPPALQEIVARALARDPAARFPSVRALARALAPLLPARIPAELRLATLLRPAAAAPRVAA